MKKQIVSKNQGDLFALPKKKNKKPSQVKVLEKLDPDHQGKPLEDLKTDKQILEEKEDEYLERFLAKIRHLIPPEKE